MSNVIKHSISSASNTKFAPQDSLAQQSDPVALLDFHVLGLGCGRLCQFQDLYAANQVPIP